MMDQELCLFPAGEAGRILDRLLLLEQVIGPEHVRQALEGTECFDPRRCRLTRAVIFWVVLARGPPHRPAYPPGLPVGAAAPAGLEADRLSFVGCLQIVRCRLLECPDPASASFTEWYQGLVEEVRREGSDDAVRRNRIHPRVVKVKMSKVKKKRPEHRPLPPLNKTFAESVVMLC